MKNKMIIFSIIAIIILFTLTYKVILNNNKEEYQKDKNNKSTQNYFNLVLIKKVNNINKEQNYLISPYSIEIALNMLKGGANGNTLTEIENLIGTRNINDITVKDRISVANAAFIKNEYKKYILDSYTNDLKKNYNSEILYDDFKSPKLINDWVNTKTNGMIDKILDSINKDFVLGLANALAIDVEWDSPFECINTTSEKFTKKDGKTYEVEMMHKELEYEGYKYLENDNATGVIIPYKNYNSKTGKEDYGNGNKLEFIGILPNDNVENYINKLTDEELNNLISSAKEANDNFQINLSIPRFKYDYDLKEFKKVLMSLGIKDAFDEIKADFTNIAKKSEAIENLYIGEAIHKTHIDLNEKGTKAAAITYLGMFKATGVLKEKKHIDISFNKPFIYIIRDNKTNEMLFFGVVYEPNKWTGSTCSEEE